MNLFLEKQKEENENFVNEIAVAVYDLKKKLMNVADRLQDKSVDLAQIRKSELGVPTEQTVPFFNDLIEQVLIPAETEYAAMLHKANGMDLKECIVMLNRVLEQLTGRIRFLKTRYLFVDEFQDTDDKQIQTFQRLQKAMPEKCRFFVVGDLKQSIYRFRGAKLSAFEQLKANSMFDWCIEHLTINYRTDGRLLRLYEPLLSKMGNEGFLPYQPELDCLTSDVQTGAKDTELFMEIPCHGKDQDRFFALCVDTILAQKQRIEELMKQHRMTSEERTIAVLVRKNWQVNKIVSAAKEKGIDVEVQSGGDLFQRDSTMDLYRLVLALNNCRNSVCLVNLLESHFSDMQLDYQNLRGLQDDQRADALQAALNHLFSERMGKTWENVVNEIHARPVLYVLKKIYDAFQPWKTYQDQDEQRAYVANYEYLMELLVRNFRVDTLTLNQIAEYLRVNIVTRQERLAREDSIENAGVRILCTTVHKSKGLEYGTVILPYTGEEIGDIRMIKLDASYSESKLAYRVLFENQLREQNSNYDPRNEVDEQIAEETRVLYVALTRAIRNCIWMKDLDSCAAISWRDKMSIKIYTYQDPYRLNAEPFWKEITNCPYFCVSQTLVNGLKGLYRADFQQGRVTTVKNLTDSIFEQWESTECIIRQHADLDNLVKAGALAVLKEPMQHNLADVLSFNRENIFQSIRVMAELNINLDEIRMEELTQEQGLVVTLYKRLMASEKHTNFVLETDFGPEELDAALVRAMQKAKDGFDASSLQKDRVVIHGVHQFTPIMLRAIETIARYKEVILLFPYQQQYKNVYQTWVNIYSAFDSQSQNFGGMDRGLVWADASRNSANILADRIGRLMEGRLESLSPTSFDVIEFDNVTEFADYAANIFERAVQKNPSSPMSGMSEQIYAADSSVNNILKVYFPEQFGERKFLDYPLGHFFLAIANMWDAKKDEMVVANLDDMKECLNAGILEEEYTGQLYSIFKRAEPAFDGCRSVEELLKRLDRIERNIKRSYQPETQEILSHVSYYAL